jgi:hypothetical protein
MTWRRRLDDDVDKIISSTYRRRYVVAPPRWYTNKDESARYWTKPSNVTWPMKRSNQARGACRRPYRARQETDGAGVLWINESGRLLAVHLFPKISMKKIIRNIKLMGRPVVRGDEHVDGADGG